MLTNLKTALQILWLRHMDSILYKLTVIVNLNVVSKVKGGFNIANDAMSRHMNLIASFPGLPHFSSSVCVHAFNIIHGSFRVFFFERKPKN